MAAPDETSPKQFLEQLAHISVAVVDADGRPWAVPVGVQKYEQGSVEWFSKTNTVHSQAIAKNPEVMLMAFTTKDHLNGEFGVFARAKAKKILSLPGVARYRATIYQAWYTDHRHKKIEINTEEL
ncbi:MAG: pyridoxamine 5'-phosphate oxidase family protein [Candidatus Saccharimonas sp.]